VTALTQIFSAHALRLRMDSSVHRDLDVCLSSSMSNPENSDPLHAVIRAWVAVTVHLDRPDQSTAGTT
jgi:hypothetical protein